LLGEHHAAAIGSQPSHGFFDELRVSHKMFEVVRCGFVRG
jgi:hypothetical protein